MLASSVGIGTEEKKHLTTTEGKVKYAENQFVKTTWGNGKNLQKEKKKNTQKEKKKVLLYS